MFSKDIMNFVIQSAEDVLLSNSSEVPVFAAVVIDGKIISSSGNETEKLQNPMMHAEFLAISKAIRTTGLKYLCEADIYVTLEPCSFCASAIEKTRIRNVFFGAYDKKCGAVTHNSAIFNHSLHKPKNIIGGIEEIRCSLILKKFFENLRN